MTGPSEVPGTDPGAVLERVSEAQESLREEFGELRDGFEKLAGHLAPLLSSQYRETLARMRALEVRLRNRQERPLIIRMARLLDDVRRLQSAADVKVHVEEALLDALTSAGYQEMGSANDQFDPAWHEAVSGKVGRTGVVTRVHRRGLACHGDVIIKAVVEVAPSPGEETGDAAGTAEAGTRHPATSEQGELLA